MSRPQGHSAAGKIMSMKNSNDTIGNRTRDLRLVAQRLNQLRHRVSQSSIQLIPGINHLKATGYVMHQPV